MVQRAQGLHYPARARKAYAEINKKAGQFHDRDLYITVLNFDGKDRSPPAKARISSAGT
jgi:hypothetical protein